MDDDHKLRMAAYDAERAVLDSMPLGEAMEYLAQNPSSAHSHAPLLYLEARAYIELRAKLDVILTAMPVEIPAVGAVYTEITRALDS